MGSLILESHDVELGHRLRNRLIQLLYKLLRRFHLVKIPDPAFNGKKLVDKEERLRTHTRNGHPRLTYPSMYVKEQLISLSFQKTKV